jgi:hypothetical protein
VSVVRWLHRRIVLAAFAAVLCWGASADAATVAILSEGASPALAEATSRLRGELAALRVEVVLLRRPTLAELDGDDARAWLERTAEARGLDAAIELTVEPTTETAAVWIFERSPRRSQATRVVVEPGTPDRAGALAIRAIEVLRSSDLEEQLRSEARARGEQTPLTSPKPAPDEARTVKQPPADVTPPPTDPITREGDFGLELGGGVLTGLSGLGPALLPLLRVGFRLPPSWLVSATLSGLGTRPTLTSTSGTVRVSQSYAALGLCYCPESASLGPYVAVSAGAARTSLVGAAEAPARGHTVEQWSLLLDTGAGARWHWSGRYYGTISGHVQVTQPRVSIRAVDEQLASTGRPGLALNLTLGTWL